jgi:hypothetical protein
MLYDELATIHSDLVWALLELRPPQRAGEDDEIAALRRADAALDRLSTILEVIAEVTNEGAANESSAPVASFRSH